VDFNYTDEQTMLADSLGRWLASDYDYSRRRRLAAGDESWESGWRQLAELGLLGLHVPEEQGGLGAGAVDTLLVMQSLGRALAIEPYLPTAVISAPLIARLGTDAQWKSLLPAVIAGDCRIVVATCEPSARFDLEQIETRATRRDARFVLNGRKSVVIGADSANQLIVSARTAGEARDVQGISLFIVPVSARGLEIRAIPTIDGQRAAEISLEDVEVGSEALLGDWNNGYEELERAIDRGIAGLCAEAVGVMERLLEMTAEHLRTRRQFGQPIGNFQALQHRAADMAIAIEQARSTALLAAAKVEVDDRNERRRAVAAAKVMAGRSGRYVGEQAVQLHGGMGMTDELPVGWYFKRLVAIDLTYGDAGHHLELYGALPWAK
jgi:alkylation response protein AidB-like acyl-CoA dehydrogenase